MKATIWLLAASFITSPPSVGAHGYESTEVITRRLLVVDFKDLNLSKEQDARELLRRIEKGARKACGGKPSFSTYTGRLEGTFEECRATTVRKAVEQVNAPMVNRIYAESRNVASRTPG